jgi:hypothetical protein
MIRKWIYAASAIALLGVLFTSPTSAWFANSKRTAHLTFNGAVRLPGVMLPAGTYTFELAVPDSNLDIVRVTSRDGSQVYFTGFTKSIERSRNMPLNQLIVLSESPARTVPPIKAWFSEDDHDGHQFIY